MAFAAARVPAEEGGGLGTAESRIADLCPRALHACLGDTCAGASDDVPVAAFLHSPNGLVTFRVCVSYGRPSPPSSSCGVAAACRGTRESLWAPGGCAPSASLRSRATELGLRPGGAPLSLWACARRSHPVAGDYVKIMEDRQSLWAAGRSICPSAVPPSGAPGHQRCFLVAAMPGRGSAGSPLLGCAASVSAKSAAAGCRSAPGRAPGR